MKGLLGGVLVLASLGLGVAGVADPGHRRGDGERRDGGARIEVRGGVSFGLPQAAVRISVGNRPYRYHRGVFYRRFDDRYVVVRAPLGAVIPELPLGSVRVRVGDAVYYRFAGVYYLWEPRGYVVVDTPIVVVEKEQGGEEPVAGLGRYQPFSLGDEEYLFKGGQFFRRGEKGLIWVAVPLGAVSDRVPGGAVSIWYEDSEYFELEGVYFVKTPEGYAVVEAPWEEVGGRDE